MQLQIICILAIQDNYTSTLLNIKIQYAHDFYQSHFIRKKYFSHEYVSYNTDLPFNSCLF